MKQGILNSSQTFRTFFIFCMLTWLPAAGIIGNGDDHHRDIVYLFQVWHSAMQLYPYCLLKGRHVVGRFPFWHINSQYPSARKIQYLHRVVSNNVLLIKYFSLAAQDGKDDFFGCPSWWWNVIEHGLWFLTEFSNLKNCCCLHRDSSPAWYRLHWLLPFIALVPLSVSRSMIHRWHGCGNEL